LQAHKDEAVQAGSHKTDLVSQLTQSTGLELCNSDKLSDNDDS